MCKIKKEETSQKQSPTVGNRFGVIRFSIFLGIGCDLFSMIDCGVEEMRSEERKCGYLFIILKGD
jgi:hypothetical protein